MHKVFEIIGTGAFAKAMHAMIATRGGIVHISDPLNRIEIPEADWRIPCIPSYYLEGISFDLSQKYIFVSKGMTGSRLPTEFAAEQGLHHAFVAGPHLAAELVAGLPTTTTIAGSLSNYSELQHYFAGPMHTESADFVCLASVVKNIVAYTCGLASGLGVGENCKASILAQGLREIVKIAEFLNLTFEDEDLLQAGVLSDLILTGSSAKSRNFKAGMLIVQGEGASDTTESMHSAELLVDRIGWNYKLWPVVSFTADVIAKRKLPSDFDPVAFLKA